ncbi:MAG: V-type ATP synthase subunit D [Thermoplasmatota archaeon]
MAQEVKATRMGLMELEERQETAQKGHDLLEEKRDALVMEFFDVVDEAKELRKKVNEKSEEAFKALSEAEIDMGSNEVKRVSYGIKENKEPEFGFKNIMGASIPFLKDIDVRREPSERGYSFFDTTASLDKATEEFENLLELVLKLSEKEQTVLRLSKEIQKTKRRVNALEYIVLPELNKNIKRIERKLEEDERESFVRLKKAKDMMEENEQ